MTLKAISWDPSSQPALSILDQLQLPHHTEYIPIPDAEAAFMAIREMRVRGAPAIAMVAALAVAAELSTKTIPLDPPGFDTKVPETAATAVAEWVKGRLTYLLNSRPTAVNLRDAMNKLSEVVERAANREWDDDTYEKVEVPASITAAEKGARYVQQAYVRAAEQMLQDDVRDNEQIGENGAAWIRQLSGDGQPVAVLTHCNTGSLATAGYGTALGVVRSLHAAGTLRRVYYTETRPYNQGSRLTGYELQHDRIPATLITDSMAAALFRAKARAENLVAVVVGADRVAANGDTANKIGTYGLALLARQHGVKFVVAAPRTTIDLATECGEQIVVEERDPAEMLAVKGPRVVEWREGRQVVDEGVVETVSMAALGTEVWNPAFDVTPADSVDAIVTEVGVVEKKDGKFDLRSLFEVEQAMDVANGKLDGHAAAPSSAEGPR